MAGDFAGATSRWEALTAQYPRDLLALKLSQYGFFYAGESERMRDIVARALPHWDPADPDYGFVLGCHAFGLEETGEYAAAERAGRDAVALNPADIWAAHAVSHVFEMEGRPREGAAWVDGLEANWRGCNNFAYHALWHRCLFLLELGAADRVLDLYDRDVRPESTDDLLDISNAVSLLWRLEQRGVDVGDRWQELAERSQAHEDDHLLIFGDVHYVMALAAAGRADSASLMIDNLSRYAAESGESQAAVAREPGLALVRAVLAHRGGDHGGACDELLAVRPAIRRTRRQPRAARPVRGNADRRRDQCRAFRGGTRATGGTASEAAPKRLVPAALRPGARIARRLKDEAAARWIGGLDPGHWAGIAPRTSLRASEDI